MSEQFVSNVELPREFSETFTPFFKKFRQTAECMPVGSSALLRISTHAHLGVVDWSDISCLTLPSAYKFMHLDPMIDNF